MIGKLIVLSLVFICPLMAVLMAFIVWVWSRHVLKQQQKDNKQDK